MPSRLPVSCFFTLHSRSYEEICSCSDIHSDFVFCRLSLYAPAEQFPGNMVSNAGKIVADTSGVCVLCRVEHTISSYGYGCRYYLERADDLFMGSYRYVLFPVGAECALEFLFLLSAVAYIRFCRAHNTYSFSSGVCVGLLYAETSGCISQYSLFGMVALCGLSKRICDVQQLIAGKNNSQTIAK